MSCTGRPGIGEDAYDCKQSKIPYRETESKTRRNSGRYFYKICSGGDEIPPLFGYGQKRSSGYSGDISWNLLWNPEMGLSDESEKYQILRGVINKERMEIFDEEDFIQDIAAEIGKVKNNRIPLEEFVSEKCSADAFRNIYRNYERHRKELKKIDFDDMLVLCYELFRSRPDVLAQWQKKFRYVLIDEFQDINRIQYDVIRMLAQPENNLFVVGDDDQAIYGFRGADSELMLGFGKDFPDAKQILLGMNYRSTANIVQNSLKLIENNVERYSKKLEANREGGSCLHIQEVKDPVEEAEYVLEEIQKCKENGIKEEEIAILFRVHTDARAVVEAMVERKIPFQMKEHLPNIYEHFIAKDIMAYFRMASGSRTRQDFLQIMNRPKRYISSDILEETACQEVRFLLKTCGSSIVIKTG